MVWLCCYVSFSLVWLEFVNLVWLSCGVNNDSCNVLSVRWIVQIAAVLQYLENFKFHPSKDFLMWLMCFW